MGSRPATDELNRAACDIAEGCRAGQWPHLRSVPWREAWSFLLAQLESRVPGHRADEYARALNQGFADSR